MGKCSSGIRRQHRALRTYHILTHLLLSSRGVAMSVVSLVMASIAFCKRIHPICCKIPTPVFAICTYLFIVVVEIYFQIDIELLIRHRLHCYNRVHFNTIRNQLSTFICCQMSTRKHGVIMVLMSFDLIRMRRKKLLFNIWMWIDILWPIWLSWRCIFSLLLISIEMNAVSARSSPISAKCVNMSSTAYRTKMDKFRDRWYSNGKWWSLILPKSLFLFSPAKLKNGSATICFYLCFMWPLTLIADWNTLIVSGMLNFVCGIDAARICGTPRGAESEK